MDFPSERVTVEPFWNAALERDNASAFITPRW
jgi:hypothetical protein